MPHKETVILEGVPGSPGRATGTVRILHSPLDAHKVEEGDILVAPFTSPQYMLAILRASAIVTEMGGVLSHAAIVSRERGIPCITGVKGATTVLADGMTITVDGEAGHVLK